MVYLLTHQKKIFHDAKRMKEGSIIFFEEGLDAVDQWLSPILQKKCLQQLDVALAIHSFQTVYDEIREFFHLIFGTFVTDRMTVIKNLSLEEQIDNGWVFHDHI